MKRLLAFFLIFTLVISFLSSCFDEKNTTTESTNEPIYWGKVSGVILENDIPLEGVTVTSGSRTTTTDKDGRYCIEVYDDEATVYFTKEGHITQSKTFKSSSFYRDEIDYSFIMFISARVFGKVLDENGNPVADAIVSIGDQRVSTDENGYYEFKSIIGTSMVITIAKNGKMAKSSVFTDDLRDGSHEVENIILK